MFYPFFLKEDVKVKILITGTYQGIGKHLYERLSLTHDVYGIDQYKSDTVDIIHDLNELETLTNRLKDLKDFDALIHNAASIKSEPFLDLKLETIQKVLNVNTLAAVKLSQWFVKQKPKGDGRIIFMSSTRAKMSEADTVPYTLSKSAIEGLTHSLAITLSPYHVTVNAIAPGWINTSGETLREEDHSFHPSLRVGKVEDIYQAVQYLLSHDNRFINGTVITVDGGVSKKMIYPE